MFPKHRGGGETHFFILKKSGEFWKLLTPSTDDASDAWLGKFTPRLISLVVFSCTKIRV